MDTRLAFEQLLNTRDLGGLKTGDGHVIKPGLLYRSGYLRKGSAADIAKLETLGLSKVIDFRSVNETKEQPDPPLAGTEYIHLSAENVTAPGIERDQKTQQSFADYLISRVVKDPAFAKQYMSDMYRKFISNGFTAGQYRKFLDLVLETEGPVLWHCTAGKDRAGFAAILLEEILGVDRDDIMESYLQTNIFLKPEVDEVVAMFEKMYQGSEPYPTEEVRLFFNAEEEYIGALYDEAEREYGSFENYLAEGLRVDEGQRRILKERYLA